MYFNQHRLAQVVHWQSHATALQRQLDDLADVRLQLQELQRSQQLQEETSVLNATRDSEPLVEPVSSEELHMMLKRQRQVACAAFNCQLTAPTFLPSPFPSLFQRIRELSEEKSHLEENILGLAERFRTFTLQANMPLPLPEDIEADIAKLREQYEQRQQAAVAYVKLACDAGAEIVLYIQNRKLLA